MRQLINKTRIFFFMAVLLISITTADAFLYDHTAKTNFDIITTSDPTTFLCLEYHGLGTKEMPDTKRENSLFLSNVFVFTAYYSDGASIEVFVNPEFKNVDDARKEAMRYTNRLGQLPSVLRNGISHIVVHGSGHLGFSSEINFIILYSDYATAKIAHNHLEESLFHESIHATFDKEQSGSDWIAAQEADGVFLTRYGEDKPLREDLAETALFVYSILHFPGRIPPDEEEKIKEAIPNRIEYIKTLLPPDKPIFTSTGTPYACDGSIVVTVSNIPTSTIPTSTDGQSYGGKGNIVDALFNALVLSLDQPESEVAEFLLSGSDDRWDGYSDDEIIKLAAEKFGLAEAFLKEESEKWKKFEKDGGDPPITDSNLNKKVPLLFLLLIVVIGILIVLLKNKKRSNVNLQVIKKRAE